MGVGYTIATPCRSYPALAKMMAFWAENYRSWPALWGQPNGPCYVSSPRDKDLSYDSGSCRIGFDYNASGGEWEYAYGLCRFMALRVGRLKRFEGFEDPAPYMVYDGHESWPVLNRSEWVLVPKRWTWSFVGPTGYRPSTQTRSLLRCAKKYGKNSSDWYPEALEESKQEDVVIRRELNRLAKLWDNL